MSKHWQPDGNVVPFRKPSGSGRRRVRQSSSSADFAFWRLFLLVAAFGGMAAWHSTPSAVAPGSDPSEVRADFGFCHSGGGTNCVVDGDTIWLEGENIRLAGIDAPETHDYGCAEEKALGERSTERLQELVNSGAVTVSSIERDEDVYGRKLRNVAVDGQDVGETLIAEGLARAYAGGRRSWCG